MENKMLIDLLWFFGGALSYKFLSYVFNVGVAINLFNQTVLASLLMIQQVHKQLLSFNKIHLVSLKKQGASVEEIENAKIADSQSLELWRTMIIVTIITCCPKKIRSALKFKDWESAMQLLK